MEDQEHQAEDKKSVLDSVGQKDGTFREWVLGSAGTLLVGYLTVLAVLAYPAGLITLWIQLAGYYGFDYWTALHAASLVLTTEVVGKIGTVLFYSLFTNAAVYGWCLQVWGYKKVHRGLYNVPGNPLGLEDPDGPNDRHMTTLGQFLFSMNRLIIVSITLLLPMMIFPSFYQCRDST